LAYHNAKAFVVNNNIRISDKDKCNLFNNYCNYNSHFVELNYLGEGDKITRFKKFTIKECEFLDNFRANINELPNDEAKSLAFAAISAVVLRLPFGNVDQSTDIMKHRMKQKEKYGKGTPNHDRRIGIYYDSEFNLNFKKWFLKYLNDFEEALCETPDCIAANNDTSYVLKHMPYKVDCAYFDPPYGGVSSNYASMYRFCEEYITQRKVEDDAKLLHAHKFVNLKTYESSFSEMLAAADNIPIWIFSYNDSSWKDINYITSIINKFKNKIIVESCEYDYIYRRQCGNKNKGVEYLIVAR
jgi:hypothetical protein